MHSVTIGFFFDVNVMHVVRQMFPTISEFEGNPRSFNNQSMPFDLLVDGVVIHWNWQYVQNVHQQQVSKEYGDSLKRQVGINVALVDACFVASGNLTCPLCGVELCFVPWAVEKSPLILIATSFSFMHKYVRTLRGTFCEATDALANKVPARVRFACGVATGMVNKHQCASNNNQPQLHSYLPSIVVEAAPTTKNPSTGLPICCNVLHWPKWYCPYAMQHHMSEAHLTLTYNYICCTRGGGGATQKGLQALENFLRQAARKPKAPSPPHFPKDHTMQDCPVK